MSAVLLVTLALALSLAWVSAVSLSALAALVPLEHASNPHPSTRARALAVLAPAAVALVVALVVLLPSPLSHCHCFAHDDGHPHLCIRHPWLALPLLGFAAPVATVWLIFAGLRLVRVLRQLVKGERWASNLRLLPTELVDGVEVRLVETLGLGAFTVGLWRPFVVVGRDLWSRLDANERLAVVHHEHAHVTRGDTLTQACLRGASALLPWSTSDGPWLRAWRSATEVTCDRHAATRVGDPATVAKALVSVQRLRAEAPFREAVAPVLGIAADGDLTLRVHALLDERAAASPPLTSDLRPIGLGLSALAALLVAWPGSFLHHAAESVLGFLTHH
jgi:beta-lactamase regulating signal transducer with metallopeptidase domain